MGLLIFAYRRFENGLVLVNPSHKPFEFDLKSISPGVNYKRIKATPGQDLQTNNGMPVGDKLLLNEREGIFLEKYQ